MSIAPVPSDFAADLLESETRYFELGAKVEHIPGATLVWMPGLERTAPGCVVQAVGERESSARPEAWLREVERFVAGVGGERVRIYLDFRNAGLERVLLRAGYRHREEVGLVRPVAAGDACSLTLRPVLDESGWSAKHALHAEMTHAPDGHAISPARWIEIERRKAQGGELEIFLLVTRDGQTCGGMGALAVRSVLRLKNLFVHPGRRRRGVASAALTLLAGLAAQGGQSALGTFAVAGDVGESVYRGAGMQEALRQHEWLR